MDDDPVQLDAMAALIADLGYEAVPTSGPEEVLKAVRHSRCLLVIADLRASGGDGYQFLDRTLPGVHVIVMTSDYTLDSALEAIRRGAAEFLPKRQRSKRPSPAGQDASQLERREKETRAKTSAVAQRRLGRPRRAIRKRFPPNVVPQRTHYQPANSGRYASPITSR